jgi:hypothetical protein
MNISVNDIVFNWRGSNLKDNYIIPLLTPMGKLNKSLPALLAKGDAIIVEKSLKNSILPCISENLKK